MSIHRDFRRQPVQGEMAMRHATITLPAPIRGLNEIENWAFTKPGCAVILDNWFPTEKGLRLRGGTELWCTLPGTEEVVRSGMIYVSGSIQRMFAATPTRLFDISFADTPVLQDAGPITDGNFSYSQMATAGGDWLIAVNDFGDYVRRYNGTTWSYLQVTTPANWLNSTAYAVDARALDTADRTYWKCLVAHTSPATGTFAAARTATPTEWAREMAPDGVSWITGPATAPTSIQNGQGLTHVWKYRNRLFFIQGGSMNAWCLPVNAVGGELIYIPLSGAAKRGGSLLFGASWSIDAGDGIDDKCVFATDQGELLVFTGTDPTTVSNWKQEGRYDISKPLGKNAHQQLGGDLLIATVDGIVPLSAALQKDVSALSLAAVTLNIEAMWRRELNTKRVYPWALQKWDEGNALFVAFPGGENYQKQTVAVSNLHTGAWTRYVGWDAMCFMQFRGNLFFGSQRGRILQAESTGYDDAQWDVDLGRHVGNPYVCKLVGGWEMFQTPPNQVTWLQARAAFFSSAREPFEPQLAATTDYEFRIPSPPNVGPDPGLFDVWDQGLWGPSPVPNWLNNNAYNIGDLVRDRDGYGFWTCAVAHTSAAAGTFALDREANPTYWTSTLYGSPPPSPAEQEAYAQWDQPAAPIAPVKNTMWVSIGETGFSHAPIVQVTVGQQAVPDVELVSIAATFLRMGANV